MTRPQGPLLRLFRGRSVRIAFFARKKKRTRTPQHIADALRELGHAVMPVRYGRWRGRLGGKLADALLLRRVRRFRTELVLVWKECISEALLERLGASCRSAVVCVD